MRRLASGSNDAAKCTESTKHYFVVIVSWAIGIAAAEGGGMSCQGINQKVVNC